MPHRLFHSHAGFDTYCRRSAVVVLAILPLVVGCPTEVPYQSDPTADEAPTFDAQEEPVEGASESADPPPAEPDPQATAPAETPPASTGDRYGQATTRMPWETDEPADEASPEAEQLFAQASTDPEPSAPEEAEEEPSKSGNGFGDFLGDAYAGMIEEDPPAEVTEPEAEPKTEIATPPADTLGSRYGATAPPAEETPPPVFDPTPEPKAPTTVEPSKSDLLDELWGDEAQAPKPEATPEPVFEPEPEEPDAPEPFAPEDSLPFGQDDQPLPEEPAPEAEPIDQPPLFGIAPEPETPSERLPDPIEAFEPPAEPDPVAPTPAAEPEPEPEPVFDPPPRREPPMASSAIEPLPAVPVLPFNTRHLAWLLGAKFGLAELADLDGATEDEVAEWSSEVERLAEELRIGTPASSRSVNDPAQRVGRMMRSAARVGEALASAHGVDHAALLEISLKTNALLVVAEKRPDLAGPVARAVRDAADRALLPRFLWDRSVKVLESNPTPEEAHDAVMRLHERVESFLR